jgi:hypothetical protein
VSTPLWLSHHRPDQLDRCLVIGGRHVCRRCAVLYPLAFVTAAISFVAWPSDIDPWLLAIAPLPAVIEWWLEHLGRISYSPTRQVALTIPLAIALGRGFARYLDNPLDPLFWAMVVVYGGSCAAIAVWKILDDAPR